MLTSKPAHDGATPAPSFDRHTHVDDFIDSGLNAAHNMENMGERYARFCLHLMRLSAGLRYDFEPFTSKHLLFCEYEGEAYRVSCASRTGGIGITRSPIKGYGYEFLVAVDYVTAWGQKIDSNGKVSM